MSAMWCWRRRAAGTAPAGRATACPPASPSIPGRKACIISMRSLAPSNRIRCRIKGPVVGPAFFLGENMMKTILFAAALLIPFPALAQPAALPTKLFASSANVQALVAKAKAEHKTGNTVELVVNDEGYPFQLEY